MGGSLVNKLILGGRLVNCHNTYYASSVFSNSDISTFNYCGRISIDCLINIESCITPTTTLIFPRVPITLTPSLIAT